MTIREVQVMDAVEQHRLVSTDALIHCLDPATLQPGLLDPVTKIWTPTSDEYDRIQHQAYDAWVDYRRQKLRDAWLSNQA
jgi:hypothetical protein